MNPTQWLPRIADLLSSQPSEVDDVFKVVRPSISDMVEAEFMKRFRAIIAEGERNGLE